MMYCVLLSQNYIVALTWHVSSCVLSNITFAKFNDLLVGDFSEIFLTDDGTNIF